MTRPTPSLELMTKPPVIDNKFLYAERGHAYKSKPRYIVPTPYAIGSLSRSNFSGPRPDLWTALPFGDTPHYKVMRAAKGLFDGDGIGSPLYNRAYSKFMDKMRGDRGELGAGLIEYRKTADFVADRTHTLTDYVTNIDTSKRIKARDKLLAYRSRRYQRPEVLERLRRTAFRERWAVPRWLGTRWLEAWMVIAPTIGDITNGLQALGRDIPVGGVAAGAQQTDAYDYWKGDRKIVASCVRTFHISADVVVRNPNLFLLQTLGLLNPLTIVGQVTPWSWMVGWFVNWEQVLNSWTDFAGVDVSNVCVGYTVETNGVTGYYWPHSTMLQQADIGGKGYIRIPHGTHVPMPSLSVRLPNRLSISRAATSMSLIVNKLTTR